MNGAVKFEKQIKSTQKYYGYKILLCMGIELVIRWLKNSKTP